MLNLQLQVPAPPDPPTSFRPEPSARAPSARAAWTRPAAGKTPSKTSRGTTGKTPREATGKTPREKGSASTSAAAGIGAGTARPRPKVRKPAGARPVMTRPVNRKEIGDLFDEIDEDGSGWLNVKELERALDRWKTEAQEAEAALLNRQAELTQLRKRATRLLKQALKADEAPALDLEALKTPTARSDRQGSERAKRRGRGVQSAVATTAGKPKRAARGEAPVYLVQAPTPRLESTWRAGESWQGQEEVQGSARSTGSRP